MSNTLLEDIKFVSAGIGSYSGDEKLIVDTEKGIIRNIKIIGFNSDNKRKYKPKALKEAISLYENSKVNINHPEKPKDPRKAEDRFGKFINVRFIEGKGLFGDLLYLREHPMAGRVCEAALREELNDAFGMSHNAEGEGMMENGYFVVEKITGVRHVDLVADPATTRSLKESQQADKQETKEARYSGIYAASKRRSSKAKRKFVKSKSKSANKPTGSIREGDESDEEKKKRMEQRKKKSMEGILSILDSKEMDRESKAGAICELLKKRRSKRKVKESISISGVNKVSEPKKTDDAELKLKELTEAKERLEQENAALKAKTKIRELCESNGVKFEDSLVEDFAGLKDEVIERQIKRIASASKVEQVKCPQGSKSIQEGKEEVRSPIPENGDLWAWLQN